MTEATSRPASHRTMRQLNSGLILETVKAEGPISRAGLAKRTKLAKPTVSAIVEELLESGTLADIGEGQASRSGGRRPTMLTFVARSQAVVGVYIGVGTTVVAVADGLGVELARESFDTPRKPSDALDEVAEAVRRLTRRLRVPRAQVMALGVCLPGLTNADSGTCVMAPNLGWSDVAVAEPLADRLGIPVFVHNVVQATAVAEYREGAGSGANVVAVIYEDTGIGAALVVDGRIHHGASGVAGELGHMRVPGHDLPCTCGGRGCVETLASSRALVARAAPVIGKVSTSTVFAALAASPKPKAAGLLDEAAAWVGTAAGWFVALTNPAVVVIGGAFLDAGPGFLTAVDKHCRATTMPAANEPLEIRPSALGKDAPVRGAILLALQSSDSAVRLAFGA